MPEASAPAWERQADCLSVSTHVRPDRPGAFSGAPAVAGDWRLSDRKFHLAGLWPMSRAGPAGTKFGERPPAGCDSRLSWHALTPFARSQRQSISGLPGRRLSGPSCVNRHPPGAERHRHSEAPPGTADRMEHEGKHGRECRRTSPLGQGAAETDPTPSPCQARPIASARQFRAPPHHMHRPASAPAQGRTPRQAMCPLQGRRREFRSLVGDHGREVIAQGRNVTILRGRAGRISVLRGKLRGDMSRGCHPLPKKAGVDCCRGRQVRIAWSGCQDGQAGDAINRVPP